MTSPHAAAMCIHYHRITDMEDHSYFSYWAVRYKSGSLDNIFPFWFERGLDREHGGDDALVGTALQILDWPWEWGLDKEYGGIINSRDCRGFPAQDYSQDMKFWWPQTEAVISYLYAYKLTGDEKFRWMHEMANGHLYAHFPDSEYGEWYGYLNRDEPWRRPPMATFSKVRSTFLVC